MAQTKDIIILGQRATKRQAEASQEGNVGAFYRGKVASIQVDHSTVPSGIITVLDA